jgi:hypothetical protein
MAAHSTVLLDCVGISHWPCEPTRNRLRSDRTSLPQRLLACNCWAFASGYLHAPVLASALAPTVVLRGWGSIRQVTYNMPPWQGLLFISGTHAKTYC